MIGMRDDRADIGALVQGRTYLILGVGGPQHLVRERLRLEL